MMNEKDDETMSERYDGPGNDERGDPVGDPRGEPAHDAHHDPDTGEWWVLDRVVDGEFAVLVSDEGQERVLAAGRLPPGAKDGSVLRAVPGADGPRYELDPDETDRRLREAKALRDALRRGPSGPLSL